MLRDNLVGLIEPMRISASRKKTSDDRSSCLENPRPVGTESSLTENVTSPFQAEPAHYVSYFKMLCRQSPCLEYAAAGVPLQSDYGYLTGSGSLLVAAKLRDAGALN
jgi:hypothetical protein